MNHIVKAALFSAADDILESFGLARRGYGSVLGPALGCFAAGVVVGGAAALLLAPMSGDEMLEKLTEGVDTVRTKLSDAAKRADAQKPNGSANGTKNGIHAAPDFGGAEG